MHSRKTTHIHSFFVAMERACHRISNDMCVRATSTCLKQRTVIEFLTAEKQNPSDIHLLQAVYGDETVDRSNMNRWAIQCSSEAGKTNTEDEPGSDQPVSVNDENNRKQVDREF